jgi:hypothetical protein
MSQKSEEIMARGRKELSLHVPRDDRVLIVAAG